MLAILTKFHFLIISVFSNSDLRVACKLGREVLEEAWKSVAVGVTTDEIDRVVHEATVDRQCYPSPLNYYQVLKMIEMFSFHGDIFVAWTS